MEIPNIPGITIIADGYQNLRSNKPAFYGIIAAIVLAVGLGFVLYRHNWSITSVDTRIIKQHENTIAELTKKIEKIESEKKSAELRSLEATKRAENYANQAASWRKKYNEIDKSREPKAKSGSEALEELRKQGWIK